MIDLARWHEVDRIFAEVLERPPAARPAFLDEVCAGDPALRRELERLLAADAGTSGFLDREPGDLLGLAFDDREEGGTLGPYRLLRRIGGGGMGAVYLACREDGHYQRDVAVKVLRSGLASTEALHRFLIERQILARLEHPNIARLYDGGRTEDGHYQRDVAVKVLRSGLASTEALHRFLTERQILARLEHPNIAHLYDGGRTEDGRPYLVMELVQGMPLDEYCDRHRLCVGERLVLFQKICAAVQYAHQNLLVHRDLKPGNILVTPEGEPKLLDFGIAKQLAPQADGALDETRQGLRMLTPSYASPEQVRGEAITTASDIYSLGVILYELLAGRRPYQLPAELPYEIERAICEQEPQRPSLALLRPEPPDAEEIALARRTRPQALAHRLRGDLDNVVLAALRKEPRSRYGSAAELAADVERHLRDLPVTARPATLRYRARKFLRRHRAALTAAAAVVLLVVGFVASLLVQRRQLAQERDKARYALSFLVDTFKQADPYQTQGERLTAREILDQGAQRIARELSGQPDVQAAVMDAIGEANLGLGRFAQAEPLLTRALALRRRVFGSASLPVAESLEHLAAYQSLRAPLASAESSLREALAIRRRRQGRELAAARTLDQLGQLLVKQGATPEDAPEIAALFGEALAIARRVQGPEGVMVAETLIDLGDFRVEQGNYTEAERLYRQGLAVEQRVLGERNPRLYRDRAKLGLALVFAGKREPAEHLLRSCLASQRKILGREHPDVAETLDNLSLALHSGGRYREAEAASREALAMVRAHYGPAHWQVANVLHNLGAHLTAQKRYPEGIALYEQSLEVRRRASGEDTLYGRTLLVLAEVRRTQKNYPQGLALAHQALANFKRTRGPDHTDVAYPLWEIGNNYMDQGRFRQAEPYQRRSLAIRLRRLAPDHVDVAKVQCLLAECLIRQGRSAEAVPLLEKARPPLLAFFGPDHGYTRKVERLLAETRSLPGSSK